MTANSSASTRGEAPHVTETTRTATILNALKRRAEAVLNDTSIDAQSRAIIRYALEINDPWLARLVHRVDAGETLVDNFEQTSEEEKVEALAEMICSSGDDAGTKSAALLVLMATLENAKHPKALANVAKHLAFTHCGELNLHGMVDAQVAVLESELLS